MVLAGVGTLTEIEHNWSLIDVMQGNEALDIRDEVEAYEMERARAK